MMNSTDEEFPTTVDDQEPPVKRRKVRKGTRSCWECKRRKTRCIFASADDAICVGCQRRHTSCTSQELPEDLSPAKKGDLGLAERMARVENVMKDLLSNRDINATYQVDAESSQSNCSSKIGASKIRACVSVLSSTQVPPTPAESSIEWTPHSSLVAPNPQVQPIWADSYATAARNLRLAYPIENDIKILLRESPRPALYTSLIHTRPHSKLCNEKLKGPYPVMKLPRSDAHPVTIARYMLLFAIALQSPSGENFSDLSESPSLLSHRLVTAASTWVTTREEMHDTVDSLVCIMLEGVFKVNCGDLRRAWAVYRRAMTVAQMMGLHRSPTPPLKRIDPELDVDPAFMWFRIVYMDRYLSLLLGLPQGSTGVNLAGMQHIQNEPPLGLIERELTIIASRVLERNESTFDASEIKITKSIDKELLNLSQKMPSNFWRAANFQNLIPGSPENLLETLRVGAQVYYYSLLIQIHLPFMLHGTGDSPGHEYSKITCVNAGREIVTRFMAHRSFRPVSCCSRPVDFFALLAAMTLLLAHIDAHRHQGTTNFLAHQRSSDRAMLYQALEQMDVISSVSKDVVTEESAKLIRQLLDVEKEAFDASSHNARNTVEDTDEGRDGAECTSKEVCLQVPYLGTIKIGRRGLISRELLSDRALTRPHHPTDIEHSQMNSTLTANTEVPDSNIQASPTVDHVPSSSHLPTAWPNTTIQFPVTYTNNSNIQHSDTTTQDETTLEPQIQSPDITNGIDDWIFQGVDMAFFNNLIRGSSCLDPANL